MTVLQMVLSGILLALTAIALNIWQIKQNMKRLDKLEKDFNNHIKGIWPGFDAPPKTDPDYSPPGPTV